MLSKKLFNPVVLRGGEHNDCSLNVSGIGIDLVKLPVWPKMGDKMKGTVQR